MAEMIGGGRPVTECARCFVADDHPKDVRTDPLDERRNLRYHLKCLAEAGDWSASRQLAELPEDAVGQAVLDHLQERIADGRAADDGGPHPVDGDENQAEFFAATDPAGDAGSTTER